MTKSDTSEKMASLVPCPWEAPKALPQEWLLTPGQEWSILHPGLSVPGSCLTAQAGAKMPPFGKEGCKSEVISYSF